MAAVWGDGQTFFAGPDHVIGGDGQTIGLLFKKVDRSSGLLFPKKTLSEFY